MPYTEEQRRYYLERYYIRTQDENYLKKLSEQALARYYRKKQKQIDEGQPVKKRGRPRKSEVRAN